MKTVYGSYYLHISAVKDNTVLKEKLSSTDLYSIFFSDVFPRFFKEDYKIFGIKNIDLFSEYAPLVIKFDTKAKKISIILTRDWVVSKEPLIDGILIYERGKDVVYKRGTGQIYHSKELFVKEDYKAFDLKQAKNRTKEWKKYIEKGDSSRIGYKKYWIEFLKKHNLKI